MSSQPTTPPVKRTKRQWIMLISGILAMLIGISILGFYGIRKILRDIRREELMRKNPVIEIEALHIKAPILEGTDNDVLAQATGHFPGCGEPGSGNYCIAGHSSAIYKEYFNNIKNVEMGMQITLYDRDKKAYHYTVTEYHIVEPSEIWVLDDFGDDRVTIVTCTDDGTQRQIVVGLLDEPNG